MSHSCITCKHKITLHCEILAMQLQAYTGPVTSKRVSTRACCQATCPRGSLQGTVDEFINEKDHKRIVQDNMPLTQVTILCSQNCKGCWVIDADKQVMSSAHVLLLVHLLRGLTIALVGRPPVTVWKDELLASKVCRSSACACPASVSSGLTQYQCW